MANIILGRKIDYGKRGERIITYADSTEQALKDLGHTVCPVGEGYSSTTLEELPKGVMIHADFFLDLDCGRNKEGNLAFQTEKPSIPSAVRYIDTHGHPSLHKRLAKNYDHVFFAVWDRRDIFTNHPSTHWCPNASDAKYFYKGIRTDQHDSRPFDVGFFGSKGGIDRADILDEICARHAWTKDVREIGKNRQKWPATSEAMAQCKVMFNCGQKHDGPNQRVIESMLMDRPLISDRDPRDGMKELFEEGTHYLSYSSPSELADNLGWCLREPSLAASMAHRAYELAYEKHQVKHRVEQILEVCGVKD